MYKCPFPGCNFKTDNWGGLKKHICKMHKSNTCPVCGRYYKHITRHLEVMSRVDDMHAVFYALLRSRAWRRKTENYERCVKLAMEYCEVKE